MNNSLGLVVVFVRFALRVLQTNNLSDCIVCFRSEKVCLRLPEISVLPSGYMRLLVFPIPIQALTGALPFPCHHISRSVKTALDVAPSRLAEILFESQHTLIRCVEKY